MIKVSVIVPVYKVPLDYLWECFDSLLAQTMQECEFIIVSDGAPEAECSVCDEYAAKDSRFKFFRREHAGVSATRNFGMSQAQGEYITFVDSDDWIENIYCETIYSFAKKNDSDVIIWDVKYKTGKKKSSTNLFPRDIGNISSSDLSDIICHIIYPNPARYQSLPLVACKLYKNQLITQHNIKFSSDLTICEDRLFNIDCIIKSKKVSYLKKEMYNYRLHNDSATHSYSPTAFSTFIKFLDKVKKIPCSDTSTSVSSEYIRLFFITWELDFLHKDNVLSIKERCNKIQNIIKSDVFQQHIRQCNKKYFSFLIKTELFFFKKKITFPIYLHALKAKILNELE